MAVPASSVVTLYHPSRGAPTTTITINFALDNAPKPRRVEKLQSRDVLAGAGIAVYNLEPDPIQYIDLNIKNLTQTDKDVVVDFIENKIDFSSTHFDLDIGSDQYDNVLYWQDDHNFQRPRGINLYSEIITLIVDPT